MEAKKTMKNIEFKNIFKLCSFNLMTQRKVIVGWSVAIFLIMTLYMILFPFIQDLAQAEFDAMPEELLQFMGMEKFSDMSNYVTYFGMIFNIILIAISIFAATFSAGLITKEEKSKSIEFLNSLSVSRSEIYISKYLTSLIAILIVLTGSILTTIACGFIGGGTTFVLGNIITIAFVSGFAALFFGGIGFMLAGIKSKLGSGSIVSSVVLASYMIGYLGELLTSKADLLTYFSPFVMLNPAEAISFSSTTMLSLIAYVLVYIAALFIGHTIYKKRDLEI